MRKMISKILAVMISTSVILTGCGKTAYKPDAVNPNVDKCVVCNMQVPNDRNATEVILKNGKPLKFDDIGCMHKWLADNGDKQVGEAFVRDYNTANWIPLKTSTFVYDQSFKTPMAYGIYSFKTKEEANQFVKQQGSGAVYTKDELFTKHDWTRNMELMKEIKKEKMKNKQKQQQNK